VLLARSDGTLAGEAALVDFVWQAAPLLSLAHDVSDGGLEQALAEASAFSGHDFRAEADASLGSLVLACASGTELDWPHLTELGVIA
jgi:phosphoribosylformylglycinamidine (FGAM) synthase-like enzyme